MRRRHFVVGCLLAGCAALGTAPQGSAQEIVVVSAVTPAGDATPLWHAILRRRLDTAAYDSVAALRPPLDAPQTAWSRLIHARAAEWLAQTAAVAAPYHPAAPPATVVVVLGNRGASDAFTHDPRTIGFDLAALQQEYGDASLEENVERIDRLFRHEYAHLMQKSWLSDRPYPTDTPLRLALAEIWTEGLGTYHSMSDRWRATAGEPSDAARAALATLAPRFVARVAALACADDTDARRLAADLSWGRFDRKWGALTAGLWLEAEASRSPDALQRFVAAGPEGVWALASRHLSAELGAVLDEARAAEALCT
jgi:hypothetical protein